jgi:alanyl-tRNA synthetase
MFGCERSRNAHIERKKSKCDYTLPYAPTDEQIAAIEQQVNDVIAQQLPVTAEFVTSDNVPAGVDLGKLPADASETLRIIRVGDYDICACIGTHVGNTREIGTFRIISHSYENGTLRLRFKLA